MRNIRMAAVLVAVLLLAGCESSRTINGKDIPCYGLNGEPQKGVKYEISVRNAVVSLAFGPIPIIVTILTEVKCPVSAGG